jgi:tetratricopeptide (TPR) repeat protein
LERWACELKGERQREAVEEMDLEVENARTAWYWALAHEQVNRLAQGVDGMWLYHTWRIRYEEAEAAFGAAARGMGAHEAPDEQRLRAKLLIMWSYFQLELGRTQQALQTARQGEELLHELEQAGDDVRHELALAAFHRARRRFYSEDILGAQEAYAQSVTLYEQAGDRWGQARALAYLGWLAEHLGHYNQAQELCEKSLAIQDELGDRRGMAGTMLNLGILSWVQGRLEEADRLLRESMSIFWELDDWNRVAQAMRGVGEVLVRSGQFDPGLALMECSLEIYDDLGHHYGRQVLVSFLGEAKAHLGRYAEARADAQMGAEMSRAAKNRWRVAFSQFVEGMAALAEGASQEALRLFRGAIAMFEEVQHRENRGWVSGPLGLAAREAGETAMARRSVVEALQIGVDLGAFIPVLYALPAAALLLADQGAAERAVEVYACASRYGFVADSCWFEALTAGLVAEAEALLPAKVAGAARARGEAQDWDAMAARLLAEL